MQTSQAQASHQMHLQQGHQTQAGHGAMPQQQQRQMGPGVGRQQMTQVFLSWIYFIRNISN